MKNVFYLIIFQFLIFSCEGQEKKSKPVYSQKVEYGFIGPLKSVKVYGAKVDNDSIPVDTLKYIIRVDYFFNKNGDLLTRNSQLRQENYSNDTKITYSGTGRNLKFKKEIKQKDKNTVVDNYALNWADDYNYEIVKVNNQDDDYTKVTLDKNYILIKAASKIDSTYFTDNLETTFNKGRIEKVYSLSNVKYDNNNDFTSRTDITQSYDKQGNPTKIFSYTDGILEMVYFKFYEYY